VVRCRPGKPSQESLIAHVWTACFESGGMREGSRSPSHAVLALKTGSRIPSPFACGVARLKLNWGKDERLSNQSMCACVDGLDRWTSGMQPGRGGGGRDGWVRGSPHRSLHDDHDGFADGLPQWSGHRKHVVGLQSCHGHAPQGRSDRHALFGHVRGVGCL